MDIDTFIEELEFKYSLTPGGLKSHLDKIKKMNTLLSKSYIVNGNKYEVTRTAMGPISNQFGDFYQINFSVDDIWKDYKIVVKANIDFDYSTLPVYDLSKEVYLRIDSGCEPGQIFGDLMCDCQKQLNSSLKKLGESDQGLIIHIPSQDGRGMGTAFHLATLYLQEHGLNTVESFQLYSGDNTLNALERRDYDGAIAVMNFLGLHGSTLNFGTNNPKKIEPLTREGFLINRDPIEIETTEYTRRHLEAKRDQLGHILSSNVLK